MINNVIADSTPANQATYGGAQAKPSTSNILRSVESVDNQFIQLNQGIGTTDDSLTSQLDVIDNEGRQRVLNGEDWSEVAKECKITRPRAIQRLNEASRVADIRIVTDALKSLQSEHLGLNDDNLTSQSDVIESEASQCVRQGEDWHKVAREYKITTPFVLNRLKHEASKESPPREGASAGNGVPNGKTNPIQSSADEMENVNYLVLPSVLGGDDLNTLIKDQVITDLQAIYDLEKLASTRVVTRKDESIDFLAMFSSLQIADSNQVHPEVRKQTPHQSNSTAEFNVREGWISRLRPRP